MLESLVARMERSVIRERWCKLLNRPRISLTLHAGYELCILVGSKEIGPCLRLWARGSPALLSLRFPLRRGGRRADKAHGLDYARPAQECVAPGRARIAGLWA